MFGRETPHQTNEEIQDRAKRLTPNDFKWFNHPAPVQSTTGGKDVTHQDRSYHEKCSGLFDHRSPSVPQPETGEDKEAESMGELKRRANVYYSDLFGRNTPMAEPDMSEGRRAKNRGPVEDQITVHQDWTDSRTELLAGARSSQPESPSGRRRNEFNQARVFGGNSQYEAPPLTPLTFDNSSKVKESLGGTNQEILQAHLRSSVTPQAFYDEASNSKHWEVVELHISGLREDADEGTVRKLANNFDLHIVKIHVEMDPVRNFCKGRAKIMVRYNPMRDSIEGLVRKLQETNLRVEV